ncbi:MAG: hypothetical protein ACI4MZ_01345 [Christensenellales bacterium]
MDEEMRKAQAKLSISSLLSKGLEGEAATNKEYFSDLSLIVSQASDAGLSDEQIDFIVENISEIIADEINHQQRFAEMVAMVSEITPNKD